MPTEGQTIQAADGETYRLTERLGRGAIATVWKAEGPGGRLAAVKVAHPALHPDLRRQFETEYETLHNRILKRTEAWSAGRDLPPTPSFIQKAGADALVLEWIEAPTLAAWVKDVSDLAARQEQLVEPAYQYAWFLDFLHNRVGIGQSDRKLGDLHWDAGNNRLVVLDWNVVAGVDRAAEDVYKFGEFWYALLLEAPPVFGADLADNPGWEKLSAGWRSLLAACLRGNREARPSARVLLGLVAELRAAYRLPGAALLSQGQELLAQFKESREADRWERLSRAHLQLDLAWRRGLAEAQAPADEARWLLGGRGQAVLQDAREDLELGRYNDAQAALDQAEVELGGDLDGQLQVARWRCLANAALASRGEDLSGRLRDQMADLVSAIERFEGGQWLKVEEPLGRALEALPAGSETQRILSSLSVELSLRGTLQQAQDSQRNQEFDSAAQAYDQARAILRKISYREALAPTLVDLADEQGKCEHSSRTRGRFNEILAELQKKIENGDYGQASNLYAEALPLTGGDLHLRELLDNEFAPVPALEELRSVRQDASFSEEERALHAQNLLGRFPDHAAVRQEVGRFAVGLLPSLKQRAGMARRPTELNNALHFGEVLLQLVEAVGPQRVGQDVIADCRSVVDDLKKKQQLQRDLGWDCRKGDQQQRDKAVEHAARAGIELYDDDFFSIDNMRKFTFQELEIQRLEGLLAARERVEASLDEKKRQTELLIEKTGKSLVQAWDIVEKTSRQLKQLTVQQKEAATDLEQDLEKALKEKWEEAIRGAEAFKTNCELIKKRVDQEVKSSREAVEVSRKSLESELNQAQQMAQQIQRSVQQPDSDLKRLQQLVEEYEQARRRLKESQKLLSEFEKTNDKLQKEVTRSHQLQAEIEAASRGSYGSRPDDGPSTIKKDADFIAFIFVFVFVVVVVTAWLALGKPGLP